MKKFMLSLMAIVLTGVIYAESSANADSILANVVTRADVKLSFVNDEVYPWTIQNGCIQNSNCGHPNTISKFSISFTITEISQFSFWSSVYFSNSDYLYEDESQYFCFKINGKKYMSRECGEGITSLVLEPGEYTMEWCDSIYDWDDDEYLSVCRVKNIELSSDWLTVELVTAGSLGVEVLYKVNLLKDVEMLKVNGNLNSTDWTTIKNMDNLIALDLSEAKFDAVPSYAFDGLSSLSKVVLPEGVKTIGEYAFRGTQILDIDIPATVTSIGQYAFAETRVRTVNFTENSNLRTIGYRAFSECSSLEEFIMPNTVTSLGTYNDDSSDSETFYECTSLRRIVFSDNLKMLGEYVCSGCSNLVTVHLPENLYSIQYNAFNENTNLSNINFPESLREIEGYAFYNCGLDSALLPLKLSNLGSGAFYNCNNLKYVELPSYIGSYNNNFYGCKAIEKIVCQSATPPSIAKDPFSNGRAKSEITLVVPSFAVVNYKLDTYWYQFGSIEEGDDIDYWRITSALSLTNNRRMNGKPDIDLYYGGCFTVGGNAPMETGIFNLYVDESNPGRLLNDCANFTVDSLNTYYSVEEDKWYFFTPMHDVDLANVTHSANASYVFRYYDGESRAQKGTGNSWRNVDTGKLIAGQGYILHCDASGNIIMPADTTEHEKVLTTGDITTTLKVHESTASANKSWNYVGNPYPSYYDIYYMDFTAPITVWTGSTYKAYSIADDNFVLRPMQSFFVQKPDEIDNIVFHKEGRQLTSTIERPSYVKTQIGGMPTTRFFFDLQIVGDNEEVDETRVVINDGAKIDYEVDRDASKFMSIREDVPQIFTIDKVGNYYAINERPMSDSIVNLAYRVSKAGYYTIGSTRFDGDIILYDSKEGKAVDLATQDYYFFSEDTEGIDDSRFVLRFDIKSTPTDVENIKEAISVHSGNGCIDIMCEKPTKIYVYTVDGRKVCEQIVDGDVRLNMPSGVYIVKSRDLTYKTVVL